MAGSAPSWIPHGFGSAEAAALWAYVEEAHEDPERRLNLHIDCKDAVSAEIEAFFPAYASSTVWEFRLHS